LSATPIYLDHNATAPTLPEVREAMAEALSSSWGNPSSVHGPGRAARAAVESARLDVAALIGADREEIVFTSGGTEGDHLAIRGLALAAVQGGRGRHLVSSRLEHPAVLGALGALTARGFEVSWVPPGPNGIIAEQALAGVLRADAALVSLALANHELGNLADVRSLCALAHDGGALFHTDAVQAAGKAPIDVRALAVDALTISGHKLGGPKGVGAVFIRRGLQAEPLLEGGHQEKERRAGTENVPGILGLAAACRRARAELPARAAQMRELGARLQARLLAIPGARLHGDPERRLPGTVNVGFTGAPGELVVIGLDLEGVAVSSGAACSSGTQAPSTVLLAMGLEPARAREAVRFSLGPSNTAAEVDRAVEVTVEVVARVRAAAAC
jgi:cysteine desulfurase